MKLIDEDHEASCLEFDSMKSEVENDIRGPRFDGVVLERPVGFGDKRLEIFGEDGGGLRVAKVDFGEGLRGSGSGGGGGDVTASGDWSSRIDSGRGGGGDGGDSVGFDSISVKEESLGG